MELNKIYNMDCLDGLKQLPNNSIDLVVTSPPYDNLRIYNGNINQWNLDKFKAIANELYRVVKDGGVIVWVVADATVDGSETGTSFRQALYFKDIGFKLNDTMIWEKSNPMPQVRQPRYTQGFEYMFVLSKGKPKTFNPVMEKCKCEKRYSTCSCKKITDDKKRVKKDITINKFKKKSNVWVIPTSQNKTKHPAVFPKEIPLMHISTWSNPGDVVLDPFVGSGTTAIASINTSRQFIGFEIDESYYNLAVEMVVKEQAQLSIFDVLKEQ